jgi:hypothetical protein
MFENIVAEKLFEVNKKQKCIWSKGQVQYRMKEFGE